MEEIGDSLLEGTSGRTEHIRSSKSLLLYPYNTSKNKKPPQKY